MRSTKEKCFLAFSVSLLALFGAFIGQSVLVPAGSANAEEKQLPVSATITPTISLSTEGADATGALPIEVDPGNGVNMGSGTVTVKISTNDPTGYSLFVTTDKADTTLSQAGVTERVRALEGETDKDEFPEDRWGYSIDGGNTYRPVQPITENPVEYPAVLSTAERAKVYNDVAMNHETEVTIGAKVSATIPSGTYSNTVVFTALPNSGTTQP